MLARNEGALQPCSVCESLLFISDATTNFWLGMTEVAESNTTCWNWDCDGEETLLWNMDDNNSKVFNESMYFDDVRFDDGDGECVWARVLGSKWFGIEDADCSLQLKVVCEVECQSREE